MDFVLANWVETRSDNLDLKGYTVYLDNKKYMMYYDKDTLREVYFLSEFSNYFMSCRTDMSTISHYYIKKIPDSYYFLIKRYENNIYNRAYVIINNNLTASYYRVDSVERIYKSYPAELSLDLSKKIQGDLLMFLSKFNKLGLSDLFSPQEH